VSDDCHRSDEVRSVARRSFVETLADIEVSSRFLWRSLVLTVDIGLAG
jgi:hypothetical protein